ncbi:LIM and SH3 domain protein F42H10.3-like isoform X2 [Littorina saxatilis]|uniref:LIM and SH3 domain protein F42H10.3-like isoform X2 n=1 Tax=Littorina saxatilis TaxID=31220 RepID=UPI0038B50421
MSKKCAKCTKTVYPTEELKCLDKVWHKACFKCESCGMTLNMKNYKGYEKLPYCNAHYPTSRPTQVADTPESRRIAENTKIQSQVKYHADFERQKGHKTSVADDPETARIRQNTAIQSNINYWGVKEQRDAMEGRRPNEAIDDGGRRRNPGKISDYDPGDSHQFNSPYSGKPQANIVYDSQSGEGQRSYTAGERRSYTDQDRRSYTDQDRRSYTHDQDRRSYTDDRRSYTDDRRSYTDNTTTISNPGRRQPGSIADYDPMTQNRPGMTAAPPGYQAHPEPVRQPPQPAYQPPVQPPPPQVQKSKGLVCKAMYDYQAADSDEVSFMDGDLIIECTPVDAGWMTGRVERSGQYGMLPSNYVERIN